jgi:hypothetical protein
MEIINSRFITYPDTVEPIGNHTVVLVDADVDDVERIGLFLKSSVRDFDVYLYKGEQHDLEWLNYIHNQADQIILNDASQVTVSHDSLRYGPELDLVNPLDYFIKIDKETVDNPA